MTTRIFGTSNVWVSSINARCEWKTVRISHGFVLHVFVKCANLGARAMPIDSYVLLGPGSKLVRRNCAEFLTASAHIFFVIGAKLDATEDDATSVPKHHSFTNITGLANYADLNSGVVYESQLERDDFIYWITDPDVVNVVTQPTPKKEYIRGGKKHTYTPDFLVNFTTSSRRPAIYVECKYSDRLNDDLNEKHECIRRAMEARGENFVVRTEKDTYDDSFSARRFLLFLRDEPGDVDVERMIRAEVEAAGEIEMGVLLEHLARGDRRRQLEIAPQVWRLAALRQIRVTLTSPLGEHTKIHAIR